LADAGPVVVVAERGGNLDQGGVVEVATIGPLFPLVEGVAEVVGPVCDAFEVVPPVEYSTGRVNAVVAVDDGAKFVDPVTRRCGELLGSFETLGSDREDVGRGFDFVLDRPTAEAAGSAQHGLGIA
jgi:hypothetical protein